MYTLLKTSAGAQQIALETALFEQGKLFLEGTIDSAMADELFKQILYLCANHPEQPIQIIINSTGGSVEAGLKIYDAIRSATVPVITFCTEKAYSMAALIFCAGEVRKILPQSRVMIHLPYLSGELQVNTKDIRHLSRHMEKQENKLIDILVRHTGKSRKEIEEVISYDHYFDANEAIEFGLCDEIAGIESLIGKENE